MLSRICYSVLQNFGGPCNSRWGVEAEGRPTERAVASEETEAGRRRTELALGSNEMEAEGRLTEVARPSASERGPFEGIFRVILTRGR